MRRRNNRCLHISLAIVLMLVTAAMPISACVNVRPQLYSAITPNPTPTLIPTPEQTVLPTDTPQPSDTPVPESTVDALGNTIIGADHYTRYITFTDILVYEESGDTFVDCIANNSYPLPIVCAVDIVFIDAEGIEMARASLQMRDAKYLLELESGETTLFAYVLTDTTLLDCEFVLEYNLETSVHPRTG